jgi:tetratricopeptide (TPR) repeat protein
MAECRARTLDAFDRLTDANITPIVVLDDAHRCRPELLAVLARALVKGDPDATAGSAYFEPQAPATSRRLIVIATAWSRDGSQAPFWRWADELTKTGATVRHFDEASGWFPNLDKQSAVTAFTKLVPTLAEGSVRSIIEVGTKRGRINPLLLMQYVALAIESRIETSDDIDTWVKTLPASPEDIGTRRFEQLPADLRDAARFFATLGEEFPLRPFQLALEATASDNELRSNAKLASMATYGYIEWPGAVGNNDRQRLLLARATFADETDFAHVTATLQRFPRVGAQVDAAVDHWFAELLTYLSADLAQTRAELSSWDFYRVRDAIVAFATSSDPPAANGDRIAAMATFRNIITQLCTSFRDSNWSPLLLNLLGQSVPAAVFIACNYDVRDEATLREIWRAADHALPLSRMTQRLAVKLIAHSDLEDLHDAALRRVCANPHYFLEASNAVRALMTRGDLQHAKTVLAQFPDRQKACRMLADVYTIEQNYEQALAVLKPFAHAQIVALQMLDVLAALDRPQAGLDVLAAVNNAKVATRLAEILAESGNRQQALEVLERFSGDDHVVPHLARLYAELGRIDRAKEILRPVKNDVGCALHLARLLESEGHSGEAIEVLRPFDSDEEAAIYLAQLLVAAGQRAEAVSVLSHESFGQNAALYLAKLHLATGDGDEATKTLERFSSIDTTVHLANGYLRRGERLKALEVLAPIAGSVMGALALARLRLADDDLEGAIAVLVPVASEEQVAIQLAVLLIRSGDSERAKDALSRARSGEQAVIRLADLLVDAGDLNRAIEVLERLRMKAHPAIRLSKLHVAMGNTAKAIEVLEWVCANAQAAVKLSELHVATGNTAKAIEVLAKVSSDPQAAVKLSELHVATGNTAKAIEVLAKKSTDEQVGVRLSELLWSTGHREEAKAVLERLDHKQQPALRLALLRASDGDFAGAVRAVSLWAEKYGIAALVLARVATSGETLEHARALIGRRLAGKERAFMFQSLCAASESVTELTRAVPASSRFMSNLVSFLHDHAARDSHVAGLYVSLADRLFPRELEPAVRFALAHAASDPYCAVMLAQLPLSDGRVATVLESLAIHARSGNESARVALGQLAIQRRDVRYAAEALSLISKQEELTTKERVLFEALSDPKPQFQKVRDIITPSGRSAVWRVKEPGT